MKKTFPIGDAMFDESFPVNPKPFAKALFEFDSGSITSNDAKRILWVLMAQAYGQLAEIDLHDEWRRLYKIAYPQTSGEILRTALEESIEHWQRLYNCKSLEEIESEGYDASVCALCKMFARDDLECEGCPVEQNTGMDGCDGTPYYDVVYYFNNVLDGKFEFNVIDWQQLTNKELEFLKSLRK